MNSNHLWISGSLWISGCPTGEPLVASEADKLESSLLWTSFAAAEVLGPFFS